VSAPPPTTQPPHHSGITAIAWFKLIKGSLLVLSALGAFELRGHAAEDILQWIVDHGRLAPEGRLVQWIWEQLELLTDGKLSLIAKVGFAYGGLQLFESYGLFRRRKWAEWIVVIATSVPIPFELYELFHEPSLVRFCILLGNAMIAGYLWHRRTDFLSRAQWLLVRRGKDQEPRPRR
jgi:uncharacterized membrane protein (DUF2068 family)